MEIDLGFRALVGRCLDENAAKLCYVRIIALIRAQTQPNELMISTSWRSCVDLEPLYVK